MAIGQFFSLGQGRVGQYLSPRVLVVRLPFQPMQTRESREFCCFGFDSLNQAQKFMQSLAHLGLSFQLRHSQILEDFFYEVLLPGQTDLARTLAFWDRRDQRPQTPVSRQSRLPLGVKPATSPAIAA